MYRTKTGMITVSLISSNTCTMLVHDQELEPAPSHLTTKNNIKVDVQYTQDFCLCTGFKLMFSLHRFFLYTEVLS